MEQAVAKKHSATRRSIETEITIAAPAEVVWATLVDAATMASWSSKYQEITVVHEPARVITFKLKMLGRTMTLTHDEQTYWDEGARLGWSDKALPAMRDDHQFIVESIDGDTSRFRQTDEFTGPTVAVFGWLLIRQTRSIYIAFNRELKAESERRREERAT
jgi:hypothetical protein